MNTNGTIIKTIVAANFILVALLGLNAYLAIKDKYQIDVYERQQEQKCLQEYKEQGINELYIITKDGKCFVSID